MTLCNNNLQFLTIEQADNLQLIKTKRKQTHILHRIKQCKMN